jgi:trehalose/maltose hydrolase-like predicted phosphorylase
MPMSGIETVKVIVDAERQAAKIIDDAMVDAAAIRKRINSLILDQHQQMLSEARKEAAAITARAEAEGRLEAERSEKESVEMLSDLVAKASAKKDATVEKLVTIIMRVEK